jgi:hypothetical protein
MIISMITSRAYFKHVTASRARKHTLNPRQHVSDQSECVVQPPMDQRAHQS